MPSTRSQRLLGARIRRALVRSRVKLRILFALLHLEEAYLADVARDARTSDQRVRGALFGDGESYARASSLVRLRLVRVRSDEFGDLVRLSPLGERTARAWRRESMRVAWGAPREPSS